MRRSAVHPRGSSRRTASRLVGVGWRGLEGQGDAVDAVAQSGRRRTIVEDVAEVAVAATAMHGRAHHAERSVLGGFDCVLERRPKARPPGSAVELRARREQDKVAAPARENTWSVFVQQRTRECRLRATLSQHRILFGRQPLPPLVVANVTGRRLGRSACGTGWRPSSEDHNPQGRTTPRQEPPSCLHDPRPFRIGGPALRRVQEPIEC